MADEATISSTRSSGQVNVYLYGVDEGEILSTDVIQKIGLDKWIGEFGAENVLDFLKQNYPELFND